ncbi:MAG: hypothetical protein RL367_169, partial [Pseudomonadota bacterium]
SFGLMEMSRQRLRTGVLEASTKACPHCEGTGLVRTASSAALSALRLLEEEAMRGKSSRLTLRASQEAAVYVLNRKRTEIGEIELRYFVMIDIVPDGETEGARMTVEGSGPPPTDRPDFTPIVIEEDDDDDVIEEEDIIEEEEEAANEEPREGTRRRRSRRRRGRKGPREDMPDEGEAQAEASDEPAAEAETSDDGGEDASRRKGRRGRRGGRRRRGETGGAGEAGEAGEVENTDDDSVEAQPDAPIAEALAEVASPKPRRGRKKADVVVPEVAVAEPEAVAEGTEKPKRTRKAKVAEVAEVADVPVAQEVDATAPVEEEPAAKPKRSRAKKTVVVEDAAPVAEADDELEDGEPRRGWWQRTFGQQD